ncbi:MAG: DNA helicase RecQ [Betaproteobacteria bacterium]|nr:DNA helicase RecQ [Betaproteobacteria bacterium]
MSTALSILNRVFGYPAFRGRQADVVDHVTGGGDALVLMPTGGGKSLCYQIPALLRRGTGVVVSPLIALMHDQVMALREVGVRTAYLNSALSATEASEVEQAFVTGELDLIYVAPERLVTARFMALLARTELALFAIDEAHCVSQWGHDFRPEYIALSVLHERFPAVPRIALTATADAQTRAEIVARLQLEGARQFVSSFDRPNIRYQIVEKNDPRKQLLAFIQDQHPHDAGIVYCLSRRKVEETALWLTKQGIAALAYHAGMDVGIRRRHQDRFLREEGIVMVATIAFGMGIDKPDVRFVAHLDLPKSIEGYYQETGRAGRDGAPADAWMAYGLNDVVQQRRMIESSEAEPQFKRMAQSKLEALLALCEATRCRRVLLLDYFGETAEPCGNCDVCLVPPETWDGTVAAQKALSAIYRTGGRFGAGHLIDVLRGQSTDKIQQWRHQQLSVFGVGSDLDEKAWRAVLRQLMAHGYVSVDHEAFGALTLTDQSRAVLKGEVQVWLRKDLDLKPAKRQSGRSLTTLENIEDEQLFEQLKIWRQAVARALNVPAYVIFHNTTLIEVAQRHPATLTALGEISGIGAHKLEAYGADMLTIINASD